MKSSFCLWLVVTLSLASGIWLSPLAAEDSAFKWTTVGDLHGKRTGQTTTLLPDGRVLITGGYGGYDELSDVEIYDPAEGTFTPEENLHGARTFHTATLLNNGLVLVAGGQCHGAALASAELYNPATREWTETGSLHLPHAYHTATLLPDGRVLVIGGTRLASPPVFAQGVPQGGALNVAEIYDPATGKWSVTDDLHVARYFHTATLLKNGQVLVTGGIGSGGPSEILDSAEIYNPATQSWTVTSRLLRPLTYQTATLLPNGQVLVTGGKLRFEPNQLSRSTELYNPSNGTWTPSGDLERGLNGHTATLLPDGRVIVVGGSCDPEVLPDVQSYDSTTGTWKREASLETGRSLHTAILLKDGRLLVTAGLYASGAPFFCLTSSEVYGPSKEPAAATPVVATTAPVQNPPPPPRDRPPPHLMTLAVCLVIVAAALVILTACFVIIATVSLIIYVVRRPRP